MPMTLNKTLRPGVGWEGDVFVCLFVVVGFFLLMCCLFDFCEIFCFVFWSVCFVKDVYLFIYLFILLLKVMESIERTCFRG